MRGLVDLCSVKKENIVEYEVVPIPHSFGIAGCLRARMIGGELASPGGVCALFPFDCEKMERYRGGSWSCALWLAALQHSRPSHSLSSVRTCVRERARARARARVRALD
jgi:hypothetical protein